MFIQLITHVFSETFQDHPHHPQSGFRVGKKMLTLFDFFRAKVSMKINHTRQMVFIEAI